MNAERVLVDTSVWVEYFRRGDGELSAPIDNLMDEGEICIPTIVLAELIQGARSAAEVRTIEDLKNAFNIIDQKEGTWLEAGRISYELRKKGKSVHLTDCYIAVIARQNGCAILTRDLHFRDIRSIYDFALFSE
ncbi:MAG: PIN domain-containing protein [Candidatus Aminicenantes bacterium]|nr:PIN domain-containing protein [Candidatus Aminicenantes bacterium]